MNTNQIILSAAGLRNLILNQNDKSDEFSFIFGNKEIKLQKLFAEFLSPIVSHFHQCDPTIKSIKYDEILTETGTTSLTKQISDIFDNDHTISQIISISQGYSIEISSNEDSETEIKNLLYMSILFGNEELYDKINTITKQSNKEEINEKTKKDKLEELKIYYKLSNKFPMIKINKIIDDFSSMISNDDENLLKQIPKNIFYQILKSENFNFKDDDALIDIINYVYSTEDTEDFEMSINFIYEQINLSNVSSEKLDQILSKIEYNKMTAKLWNQLCEVFRSCKKQTNNKKKTNQKEEKFEFDGNQSHRFEGIIHHLCLGKNKNICDEGIIDITSLKFYHDNPPKNVVDFDSNNYFFSNSSGGKTWLKIDFKDKKIRPTHYSIKTRNDNDNQNPQSWCIEVSNTDRDDDWRIIDTRENVKSVSQKNSSDTFEINTKLTTSESYRYIRFRHTNNSSGVCNNLAISSIEYFGSLIKL